MKTATRYGWVQASLLAVLICLTGMAVAQNPPPPQGSRPQGNQAQASQQIFKPEQLDQMLAPVALYPDALLSQILMATTYPSDVAEAAAWSAANPKAQGDAAVKQVEDKPWDPSVQSLVAFPQVLIQMKDRPDWVQNVGDAFLAEPDQVMASVQRLRTKAQQAGNLKSNDQQKVVVQQAPAEAAAPSTTIIQIEPTNPEVVYVPSYNPTVVYGSWAYPGYPPYYWPPPAAYYPYGGALAAGLMFGAGIAITNSLWGGMDWGHGDVNINTNRYNNINRESNRINGSGNSRWNHNADNRRGTPYRDSASRERFGQGVGGADQRQGYRGREGGAANADRQRAMQSFDRTTNNGSSAAARRGANGGAAGPARAAPGDRMAGNAGAGRGGQGAGGFADRNAGAGNAAGNRMAGAGGGDRGAGGNFGQRDRGGGTQARNNAFGGVQSPGTSRSQSNRGQSSQRSMGQSRGAGGGGGRQMSRPAPSRGGGGGRRRLGA